MVRTQQVDVDRFRFAQLLALLSRATQHDMDDAEVLAYWTALHAEPFDAVAEAVYRALRECTRFPAIPELLSRLPGRLDPGTEAENAWTRVWTRVMDGPYTYSPAVGTRPKAEGLTDEEMTAVGGLGGLYRLFEQQEDAKAIGLMHRDFLARYKAAQANRAAGRLPGGNVDPAVAAANRQAVQALISSLDLGVGRALNPGVPQPRLSAAQSVQVQQDLIPAPPVPTLPGVKHRA